MRSLTERYKTLDLSFSKRNLIIFIGDKNSYMSAFQKDVLIDHISIKDSEYESDKYIKFLDNYRKYRVSLIIDNSSVALNYADIPISQGISYEDPALEFISKKFPKETLVSYNIYNTTKSEQEIWNTIFASIELKSLLSNIVNYTSSNRFNINGIYFFLLNAPIFSRNILNQIGIKPESDLQILITTSNTTQIHLIVSDGGNIISNNIFDAQKDKGDEYMQGIIEQAVIDILISLKNYMHHNQVKPHLMILAHESLKNLLINKSKFDVSQVVIISSRDIAFPSAINIEEDDVVDVTLSYLMNKKLSYNATNDVVNEYTRLHEFNKFLSAPWYFLVVIIVLTVSAVQIRASIKNKEAARLNQKFYILSEEYRDLRKEYPDIPNLEQLVNFYYAEKNLTINQQPPFEDVSKITNYMSKNFVIYKIHWELGNDYRSYIIINAKYRIASLDQPSTANSLESEIEAIQALLPRKVVRFKYNTNEIVSSGGFVTIPTQIIIIN